MHSSGPVHRGTESYPVNNFRRLFTVGQRPIFQGSKICSPIWRTLSHPASPTRAEELHSLSHLKLAQCVPAQPLCSRQFDDAERKYPQNDAYRTKLSSASHSEVDLHPGSRKHVILILHPWIVTSQFSMLITTKPQRNQRWKSFSKNESKLTSILVPALQRFSKLMQILKLQPVNTKKHHSFILLPLYFSFAEFLDSVSIHILVGRPTHVI